MAVVQIPEYPQRHREALSTESILTLVGIATMILIPIMSAILKAFILPRSKLSNLLFPTPSSRSLADCYSPNAYDSALTIRKGIVSTRDIQNDSFVDYPRLFVCEECMAAMTVAPGE